MSTPILPFAVWASGTNANSVPANDNSLRNQILNGLVLGTANDESSPAEGDIYIVGSAPTGAYATFDEDDVTIYSAGTWYAFAPVEGIVLNVAGSLKQWDGAAYIDAVGGGGGPTFSETVTISGTSHSLVMADAGDYLRFTNSSAKSLTVQDEADEPIDQDAEFNGRNANTGDLTITEDTAVTVNPPAGGTLVIPPGGTFTLKRVAADEWDLFGVTVAL